MPNARPGYESQPGVRARTRTGRTVESEKTIRIGLRYVKGLRKITGLMRMILRAVKIFLPSMDIFTSHGSSAAPIGARWRPSERRVFCLIAAPLSGNRSGVVDDEALFNIR